METKFINHYTVNTNHLRESPRSEVTKEALEFCTEILNTMLTGKSADIVDSYKIHGTIEKNYCLAVIFKATDKNKTPLIKIGITNNENEAKTVWLAIANNDDLPITNLPSTPFVIARITDHGISDFELLQWVGDFERVLAWAWIEKINTL